MNDDRRARIEKELRATKRVTTLLSEPQKTALDIVAASTYRSVASVVRQCIMYALPQLFPQFGQEYEKELKRYENELDGDNSNGSQETE